MQNKPLHQILFLIVAALMLAPFISSGVALLFGIAFALTLGNPFTAQTKAWTPKLLQLSVVGLGGAMNLFVVATVGLNGFAYTIAGITFTFVLGYLLSRFIPLTKTTGLLLTVGTAICGGSAIAAVAPVVRAKDDEISVSLATVFFLNAAALFIFPWIGRAYGLGEVQFGIWSALAIHDTSSVVGASMQYGHQALEIGTTVKLARALWIVPLTLLIAMLWRPEVQTEKAGKAKIKWPWFILGFLLVAAVVTWFPALQPAGHWLASIARRTLVLTLFLIGCGLTRSTLKAVGFRPLIFGVILWICVAAASFLAVTSNLMGAGQS